MEFHFTDSREGKEFRDHKVSLTRDEVLRLTEKISDIYAVLGEGEKTCRAVEEVHHLSFRRACYLNRDMKEGEVITANDLVYMRPNHGIDAREYRDVIGKVLKQNAKKYEALKKEYL